MGYLSRDMIFREFDPLHVPKIERTFCVLHISSFLQSHNIEKWDVNDKDSEENWIKHVKSRAKTNFLCLKYTINDLLSKKASENDCRIDIIISVNGHIEEPEYIDYLRDINGKSNGCYHITIFQRQNIGFQWGGFHDVWLRYKDVECNWYATMEGDCALSEYWFDIASKSIEYNTEIGFNGQPNTTKNGNLIPRGVHCDQNAIDVKNFYDASDRIQRPIPIGVFRDQDNGFYRYHSMINTCHTRGGFYFCKKEMLENIDDTYGCFTHSMGCNHSFDGIILGEVCFCQKITTLGWKWTTSPNVCTDISDEDL